MKLAITPQATVELQGYAKRINTLCDEIQAFDTGARENFSEAVKRRIEAGQQLLQAQLRCPDGEWEWWIKNNTKISKSTAERWMRLARNPSRVTGADTVREALALVSESSNGNGSDHQARDCPEFLKALAPLDRLSRYVEPDGMDKWPTEHQEAFKTKAREDIAVAAEKLGGKVEWST